MRLIDADAIPYEPLPKGDRNYRTYNLDDAYEDGYNDAMVDVRNAPIIERKTGKWEHGEELGRDTIGDCVTAIFYNGWKCSACGCCVEEEREPLYKFCPNCGADMRGDDHETN